MEKDLTQKFPRERGKSEVLKSTYKRCKEVKCVTIDNQPIVLKIAKKESMYQHEKKIYLLLKNETFIPELKYYDDKHFILGITWVGVTLNRFRKRKPVKYNNLCEYINEELKTISDVLLNTYGLYHNDLRYKNICIQDTKVRVIDFDDTGPQPLDKDGLIKPKYFICQPVKINT